MTDHPDTPIPDLRLKTLNKLVGTWKLKHKDINTGKEWEGQDTYEWLPGNFFLMVQHEEFGENIKGMMLIGYEQLWGEEEPGEDLIGHWFETSTGSHYVYIWEVTDHAITFWLNSRDSGMAFRGTFSDDLHTITGGWRWPGGGYDLTMTRNRE